MSSRGDNQLRYVERSSQEGREEDDNYSSRATSGSSDLDSDDGASVRTRSELSERGMRQPMTRRLMQELQADRRNRLEISNSTPGLSPLGASSFRGLTPDPLPSAMLPERKRSLSEVLRDENPPRKDKMSAEIDQLVLGPPQSDAVQAGPSTTQNMAPNRSRQRRRSKASGELSNSRVLPSLTHDEDESRLPERRSRRIRNTSRREDRTTSDQS